MILDGFFISKKDDWLPELQSHRGYWVSGLVENTLASIQKSYEVGYKMTEFDIRITADGVIILHHDSRLNNTSLRKMTYSQILKYRTVTQLEDVLIWFKNTDYSYKLNIEIKSSLFFNPTFEYKLVKLIHKHNVQSRVLVSSFNFFSLFKVRLFSSIIKRAWLVSLERHSVLQFKIFFWFVKFLSSPDYLNLRCKDFTESVRYLSKYLPVVLWTVNDLEIISINKNFISGIISDKITPEDMKGI